MRTIAVLAILSLAACTTDSSIVEPEGSFASYRDAVVSYSARAVLEGPYSTAPNKVRAEYADCAADFLISKMPPDQVSRMDAYVSGRSKMTVGEYKKADAEINAEVGAPLTFATIDRLGAICPQALPDFHRYFGPGFNGL